jgi:hypothetical protein
MFHFETVEEQKDRNREVKYKILIYPNITSPVENLERDSYVIVLREIIRYLNSIRDDLHWTVITPTLINYGKHVEQRLITLPEYPNMMRMHFNAKDCAKLVTHRENDFDILYSHLPEHTNQLANYFFNNTGLRPKIIGYSHYVEFPNGKPNMFLQNIIGTLQMQECGLNSQWLKDEVLNYARDYFNDEQMSSLDKIIKPHYLGTVSDFEVSKIIPKTIFYNHRPKAYTGFNKFLSLMDKLWKQRKDFVVYIPYEVEVERPYIRVQTMLRNEYLNFIKRMNVAVAMERENSGWALAVMDCLSRGLPVLMPNTQFYPEKVGNEYPMFFRDSKEFFLKINNILDNPSVRDSYITELKEVAKNFSWDTTISKWFNNWELFNEHSWIQLKNSNQYEEEIIPFFKERGTVTKADVLKKFKWGYDIPWGYHRNRLRLDVRVKLFSDRYEFVG